MKLNLRSSAIEDYYKNKSQRIYSILSTIEPIESWVLDTDKTISDAIVELTNALNLATQPKLSENKEELLRILAYLSCSKVYFFTTWLDTNFEEDLTTEFLSEAINQYNESAEFSIYVERIETIRKMNVLGSIFSEKRMKKVIKILEEIKEKIVEDEEYEFY